MKSQHQTALEQEQERFGHAQARLQQQTSGSEARVASLESRLQELSQAVGSYDRLRLQDRAALQRLRERLAQLAQENTALTKAAAAKATELPSQVMNRVRTEYIGCAWWDYFCTVESGRVKAG